MTVFDIAWELVKIEPAEDGQVTCPLCDEIGRGDWFLNHYPDCAQRYINENSENVDMVENERKRQFTEALDSIAEMGLPMDDLRPMVDEMPDVEAQYSGYQGAPDEMADRLMDAQEQAMVDRMKQTGQIGYHPDPEVRRDNTTWRVGLWFDNDEGLYNMKREWLQDAMDRGDDINARGFGEYMAELLEDTSVGEELRDNERTWDDVDWDEILGDELENMIDWWYTQVVRGEIDESDWDWREDFVDDEDHQRRTDEAYKNHASEKIRDMVVDEMTMQEIPEDEPGAFERVWKQIIEELQDVEHDRWDTAWHHDLREHHFDAYMRNYLRREEQGGVNWDTTFDDGR